MIDEKKLLAKLEGWEKESSENAGLKAPALLRKVMEEVRHEATNEEIRERIEAETENDARKWIPVGKRLPGPFETVLVTIKEEPDTDAVVYEAERNGHGSWVGVIYRMPPESIKAWMPLPEPYREEKEGGKTC